MSLDWMRRARMRRCQVARALSSQAFSPYALSRYGGAPSREERGRTKMCALGRGVGK
jgi:hypothetical protein